MTQDKKDKIIATIRNLMELAADKSNEHESAVAAEKAQRLLLKYNLTEAEIATGIGLGAGIEAVAAEYTFPQVRTWLHTLGGGIAIANQCKLYTGFAWEEGYRGVGHAHGRNRFYFYGRKLNAEVCAILFDYLVGQLQDLATLRTSEHVAGYKAFYGSSPYKTAGGTSDHPVVWRTSWLEGAAGTIFHRLTEAKKSYNEEEKALVLVIDHEVNEAWQDFSRGFKSRGPSQRNNFSNSAYRKGQEDGRNIDITSGKLSGGEA